MKLNEKRVFINKKYIIVKGVFIALQAIMLVVAYNLVQGARHEDGIFHDNVRYYMYLDECERCGAEMECEYSIVSNKGGRYCTECNNSYEYMMINDKEVKIN